MVKNNRENGKSETATLLSFLHKIAGDVAAFENTPLNAIITFLNEPMIVDMIQQIGEKMGCEYSDYTDYFWSQEDIQNLVTLKETEPEKYFTVIHYENLLLNVLTDLFDVKYTVVLNPLDIYSSYLLILKAKN
jgi:hypothetical protein